MVERVSVSPKRRIVRTFACRLAISSASITIPPWTRGAQEIPFLAAPLLSASDGRAVEFQERNVPLLGQGGVDAPSIKMLRRHLLWARPGWLVQQPLVFGPTPPRLRGQGCFASFCWSRSHPSSALEELEI